MKPESKVESLSPEGETKMELDDEHLQDLYAWVDKIPLSRPKKNMTRDFSDGVMFAEIIHHFLPKMVEIHNYQPANSLQQKMGNWSTLNRKVLSKLNYSVPDKVLQSISNNKPGVVEFVLYQLRRKIELYKKTSKKSNFDEISPDGYYGGHEVGSMAGPGRPMRGVMQIGGGGGEAPGPRRASRPVENGNGRGVAPGRGDDMANYARLPAAGRARSLQNINEAQLSPEIKMLFEEKEQALLASQETVQILQAKVRRLEHLLRLKDVRIEDMHKQMQVREGPGYGAGANY